MSASSKTSRTPGSSSPASNRALRANRTSPRPSDAWSAFTLAEGFHLAHAVAALHELRVLGALAARPSMAKTLATRYRLDRTVLHGVLEYVATRTDLVRKQGARFAATPRYDTQARFLLDLYTGAFQPNAIRLRDVLHDASVGERVVNRARHAQTFERAIATREQPVAAVIRSLELRHLLDLGCGSADLLVRLAGADRRFTGWGVEMNPHMCRVARARIRASRLTRQVRVIAGDARRPGALPVRIRQDVTGVSACQMANEMFRSGTGAATAWLRRLRRALPERPLVINDYYGRLGTRTRGVDRHTLLHDYVQLISGQGIPPATLGEWRAIYAGAGYRLAHAIEDRATTQFIHVIV